MGIVSSTFASLAIRFAWNCQRFLDPRYRYIEVSSSKPTTDETTAAIAPTRIPAAIECGVANASPSAKAVAEHHQLTSGCLPGDGNRSSLHQENRRRRAAQHRYRKRPSSFDVSLIIQNRSKSGTGNSTPSGPVTHSMPSTLKRQPAPSWDSTSSSCSSSDSSDSEIEFMFAPRTVTSNDEKIPEKPTTNGPASSEEKEDGATEDDRLAEDENLPKEFAMSAAEEAAFRMTIGRGHFSRSKKDRFLNHLRLEKRLNGLNKEFFELACRAHTRSLRRRHSGDLRRIV